MNKKIFISMLIFTFLIIYTDVFASTYTRGIISSSTNVYSKTSNESANRLKNDEGAIITLYSPEAVEIIEESGNYYKIKFLFSGFLYEGYVLKTKVSAKEYETDDEYEENLIKEGFPLDYAKKLAVLHAIHPNWTFTPSFTGKTETGMDFTTAVKKEAEVVARNLISGSNTSLRSTADGAYQNGVWLSLSGSGWYAASEQTIAFYLDPRNFLDESHVFMFENLGYNEKTQTSEAVSKVLSGTFMANTFECYNGANTCEIGTHYYIDTFLIAGKDKLVSPVHLASRVKQEQGTKGSVLSLGQGFNGEYIGYYNFFNIGASGITTEDVVINGFKYAYNRNWNNQFISIYDGSATIGGQYVAIGQSTSYYQKFNTINLVYSHQYMQNVEGPYSESYTTYSSYYKSYESKEEWDDGTYDFLIPIYTNLPEYTTLDTSGNADATLKSLEIENCILNPSFQSSAYEYTCFVESDISSLTIKAETTNELATLSNPGTVSLKEDETLIDIVVKAVNEISSITYSIKVQKLPKDTSTPSEILNDVGIRVNEEFASNIELGSDISNIISSIEGKHVFSNIVITEADGTRLTDGLVKTGQLITITNNDVTKTFKIVLYGDVNGDGEIDIRDLLVMKKHLVEVTLLEGAYLQASDANKDNTVDIRDLVVEKKHLVGVSTILQK